MAVRSERVVSIDSNRPVTHIGQLRGERGCFAFHLFEKVLRTSGLVCQLFLDALGIGCACLQCFSDYCSACSSMDLSGFWVAEIIIYILIFLVFFRLCESMGFVQPCFCS